MTRVMDGARNTTADNSAPAKPNRPVADENRHIHGKRTQDLPQSHAVDEFIEGDQPALANELLFHERDYGHGLPRNRCCDLQKDGQ